MATVSFENVNKIYRTKTGDVLAVSDLSLDIADQEFVVLVGPSGCGKTTALRLLAGLEDVNTGTIRIGDRVVNRVAPRDRDVAMVFQNYALYPHMTVFKNMAFGLKMRRVPRRQIKEKVRETAALLGIEHLLDRKPAALSGGERQRVAVGRAIVREPRVFLFDEPLSNLDAKLRVHMRTEIKNLHRQLPTTVIYVTHDQEEAMTLGDRLVIMNNGVVQQRGTPLQVYNRPSNRFVAGFVGSPSMNFLQGHLVADGDVASFVGRGDLQLNLGSERPEKPQAQESVEVSLGIRAEYLRLVDTQDAVVAAVAPTQPESAENTISVTVTGVEPLGDRIRVHGVTAAGEPLVAQASPSAVVSSGQQRHLTLDASHAHLFADDCDGRRLGDAG
jgi:multiple sugar transport system ATP-binding protein